MGARTRTWRLHCTLAGGVGPACRRLKPALLATIEIETKDYTQITRQPVRITGGAFGKAVSLRFPAMGSGTRRARLKLLRTALGPERLPRGRATLALTHTRRTGSRAPVFCRHPRRLQRGLPP